MFIKSYIDNDIIIYYWTLFSFFMQWLQIKKMEDGEMARFWEVPVSSSSPASRADLSTHL